MAPMEFGRSEVNYSTNMLMNCKNFLNMYEIMYK